MADPEKKPWEGEKAPATPAAPAAAVTEPARTPPPPPANAKVSTPAAAPASPDAAPAAPAPVVNVADVGEVDDDAAAQILDSIYGDQAPLELINMVSSGVPMAEARAKLRLQAEQAAAEEAAKVADAAVKK